MRYVHGPSMAGTSRGSGGGGGGGGGGSGIGGKAGMSLCPAGESRTSVSVPNGTLTCIREPCVPRTRVVTAGPITGDIDCPGETRVSVKTRGGTCCCCAL